MGWRQRILQGIRHRGCTTIRIGELESQLQQRILQLESHVKRQAVLLEAWQAQHRQDQQRANRLAIEAWDARDAALADYHELYGAVWRLVNWHDIPQRGRKSGS